MPRSYSEEEIQEIVTAVESADNAFRAGNFAIAEEIYSQALPILEQAIGKEDPDTLACMQNLADCCFGVEAYNDACRYYEKLIGINERVFGHAHQNTIAVLLKLAKAYGASGRPADYERAMQAASERARVPVSDLLDTADRVIDNARVNESDRNAQRKQLEELQRNTQAFQQLKITPNNQSGFSGADEREDVEVDNSFAEQANSQRMHRSPTHRTHSDLRRAADVIDEGPEPDNIVALIKSKASIIVPVVGVISVIGLIVFIFLSLPSSAPTAATVSPVAKNTEETAPVETYYQTPDSQEVLTLDGDNSELLIGKDRAKCPVVRIGSSWTDIFQILVGPLTNKEIWFQETEDGLLRENGPKYYGRSSPENVVINKINAVANKAKSWYSVAQKYPVSEDELRSNEVLYTNPVTKMPAGPVLQRSDFTEADVKSIIDGAQEQSLEEAFRHSRVADFMTKNDTTGLWKGENKPKPCAVHCLSILLGADANHHLFFVHGFDRHGQLLRAATNYPQEIFLISLKDGVQATVDGPVFLDKPAVRPRRIVIVKVPPNTTLPMVHFVWPIVFALLAVLAVAGTGFESAAEGERSVNALPKGTAAIATWVFVALCFASMISLIAP